MFNWIVPPLNTRRIHWQLATSSITLATGLDSRLGPWWAGARCSYFPPISFALLFHIFASNILNLFIVVLSPLVSVSNLNIDFIETTRIIEFSSPFVVIALSSPFHLVRIYQFVICPLIRSWDIFIIVSEWILWFLWFLSIWLWIIILISSVTLVLLVAFITLIMPLRRQLLIIVALPSWTPTRLLKLLVDRLLLLNFLLLQLVYLVLVLF